MMRTPGELGRPAPARRAIPVGVVALDDRPKPAGRRRAGPWIGRVLVFVTCVLLLDALFGDRGLAASRRSRQDYEAAALALQRVQADNAALLEQKRRLERDPATLEALARKELGFIRPGEILVMVRDRDTRDSK